MGTKNNPGPFDCYAKADPDEPIFVLRAKDPLAPALVRLWAHVRRVYDQKNSPITPFDSDKYFEANQCADQMEDWRQKYDQRQLERLKHNSQYGKKEPVSAYPATMVSRCICGHVMAEHNILQDYAGPGLPAHPVEYRHCKECKCPAFQRPNM